MPVDPVGPKPFVGPPEPPPTVASALDDASAQSIQRSPGHAASLVIEEIEDFPQRVHGDQDFELDVGMVSWGGLTQVVETRQNELNNMNGQLSDTGIDWLTFAAESALTDTEWTISPADENPVELEESSSSIVLDN